MLENLDHILLGSQSLEEGIAFLEQLSGYRAALGGTHPGRGTRNAVLKMGSHAYLEILAPDPQQEELTWYARLRSLAEPLLIGYAVNQKNLAAYAQTLRNQGIPCTGPQAGSRRRPDGELLGWQTLRYQDDRGGLLPFFIDWDPHSPHPASDAPSALALLSFTRSGQLLEPTIPPTGLQKHLLADRPVQLRARLKGLHGEFELFSQSIPSETWAP
jgi:hypothetical protein